MTSPTNSPTGNPMGGLDCDAVIVGSGPSGATVADLLTAHGWSVVVLEKGANHLIELEAPFGPLGHSANDELKSLHRHLLGPDPLVEPRTFRNVFPSLSAEQQRNLAAYYDFRVGEVERVAGRTTQIVMFEPKDGLRYGHKFWSDAATGLLLKARLINDRGEVVEQFAFTDVAINVQLTRDMVKPSWPTTPPDWQVKEGSYGEVVPHETGWSVSKLPGGFQKIMEGFRKLRGRPDPVAHLVFSDGLVAISVFIEPVTPMSGNPGVSQQGGLNVFSTRSDDFLITALGEAPPATVRQIALSVARR